MKTLILYITKHGCTEKIANMLKNKIGEGVHVRNLRTDYSIDLNQYDTIIIGSSIHIGIIQRRMQKFCKENKEILLQKRLGLFISCMYEGEVAQKQLAEAYPIELQKHSLATEILGGEFNFEKMNLLDKVIVKKVANVSESICRIDNEKVIAFANKFIL